MSARLGLWEHFRRLSRFKGREDRSSFWPYAALVLGIMVVAGSFITIPMMIWTMQAREDLIDPAGDNFTFNLDVDEIAGASEAIVPEAILPPMFLGAYLAVTLGLAVILYAAAVARRLHDTGRSGAWGLMPLPFLAFISVQSCRLLRWMRPGEQPDMFQLVALAVSSILFWTALLALVALLAGASDPRANRYDTEY